MAKVMRWTSVGGGEVNSHSREEEKVEGRRQEDFVVGAPRS